MSRVLIIDDDALDRAHLRNLLGSHPDIQIVGETGAVKAAQSLLMRNNYDVVFLDIVLSGGSGFDLVSQITPGVPIIFVTGHDRHALRAFDINAHDFLMKPLKAERLAESLRRLTERSIRPSTLRAPTGGQALRLEDTIHLNSGTRALFARVADISLVQAHENYSLVQLADGTQVLVRRTLKAWGQILPPTSFLRVHRVTIANLARVVGYEHTSPRSISLRLSGVPHLVSVSRHATNEAKARLHARFPEI